MVDVNQIYSSGNALKAEDLKGHTVLVTIENYEIRKFEKGDKIVLKFAGKEKTLVLNKTNSMNLASHFSSETDNWIGKKIEIFPDKTQFNGKMVDCIRVRVPAPKSDDNIPW